MGDGGTPEQAAERLSSLPPAPTVDAIAQFVPNIVVTHPLAPGDNLALARLMGGVFCAQDRATSALSSESQNTISTPAFVASSLMLSETSLTNGIDSPEIAA
jgi:hypothetical protein